MSEPEPLDPEAAARISATIVKAIADAGEFGADLLDILRHARELHYLLLAGMFAAEPTAAEYLRGLCDAIGNSEGALAGRERAATAACGKLMACTPNGRAGVTLVVM